ncbi:CFEM domain-containing protein [Aspergillus mulundensis]|uniref:CFEM domain-containing protein n=1 Tax=Aspergillus mulundensis TaxID=1810919 RepID=A0A3D8T4J4_9EURO|nr:hypothetical protein DSM5745_00703 [Aspergillus mulundensis]RDW93381.1 hypothetical protein DSM5745_00703 [Aspergillus mulundensis]
MEALQDCAIVCFAQALPASNCSVTDIDCLCSDDKLIADTRSCSLDACTIKESLLSQKALTTVCGWPVTEDKRVFPVILILGMVLAVIAVGMRVAVRVRTKTLGLDELMAVLSVAAIVALSGLGIENQKLGLGIDTWFLSFQEITDFLHIYFAIESLYLASIALTKISMLLLYLRLFPARPIQLATKITLLLTTAWGIAMLLANVFACQPINYMWLRWDEEHEGKCIDHEAVMAIHAILNIVFDVLIITLPMPTLLKLNMSVRKKVGVIFMFAVGLVVTLISIFRCISLIRFDIFDNPTKNIVTISIWSVVEVDLSLICACMPSIRAFISYIHALIYGTPSSQSYGYGYGYSSGPRGGPSGTGKLVPAPSAVRSGTFDTDEEFDAGAWKGGKFIALQETECWSPAESRSGGKAEGRRPGPGPGPGPGEVLVTSRIEREVE